MIPFDIPNRFLPAVTAGTARRIGTTLREATTGRIIAHLQETRLLQEGAGHLVGFEGNPVSLMFSSAQLASSLWARANALKPP